MKKAPIAGSEELDRWIRQQVELAVAEFLRLGTVESPLVEAKPAWVFPLKVLIGKLREQRGGQHHTWFICGDVPFDYISSSVAETPRQAARHFVLKWQLDAERARSTVIDKGVARQGIDEPPDRLESAAELLFKLVSENALWNTS